MRILTRAEFALATLLVTLGSCASRGETARVGEGLEDVLLRESEAGPDPLAAAEGSLAAAREDLEWALAAAERVAVSVAARRADLARPAARVEEARRALVAARGAPDSGPLAAARTDLRAAEADLRRAERELEYGDEVVGLARRRVALREARVELAQARLEGARGADATTPAQAGASFDREGHERRVQALTRSLAALEAEVRAARRKLEVWHAHLVETGDGAPPAPEEWLALTPPGASG